MHLGILHELPVINLLLYFVDGSKIIMHAILLPLAWFACRMTDAETEFIAGEVLLEEFN